jgi:hypothetical protein
MILAPDILVRAWSSFDSVKRGTAFVRFEVPEA